ncbi:nicotinate-nucleotide--dimethylbenzimidazole phosphoribosyltransferase [Streptomyces sp. ALI-76-A]|uniref:nicotinate-nucleotide--dimethylbenzimidazole phosphoribosyltransferase n=1 Tax=Streptomyces sp. ALI-76-A TaxID=3025736 RepID=UPI00256F06D5|nr:nicotinate-nucleotide--dimethylbenzimidazole phosphoribosyltransferase [Streptomyces sp. ALI-76-A]MDL5200466.1 nicotinate-nucleotide--dimethylbenzimidazole phosphoribosyltransferase [Streptomyces sp. ALI-76-A]
MTDTGQVPGEGLPENAGMVDQPGVPAHGAYTYLSETTAEDEDLLLLPSAQGAWGNEVPPPAPEPVVEAVHEPGPHEISGRDSGSVDLSAVRLPNPTPPPAAPVQPRRPLHLGPPIPDTSASPVRSLADRGAVGTPVRQSATPANAPEYLDVPQPRETPAQGVTPWGASSRDAVHAGVQAPVHAEAATAETVVPGAGQPEPAGAAQAAVSRLATEAVAPAAPLAAEPEEALPVEEAGAEPGDAEADGGSPGAETGAGPWDAEAEAEPQVGEASVAPRDAEIGTGQQTAGTGAGPESADAGAGPETAVAGAEPQVAEVGLGPETAEAGAEPGGVESGVGPQAAEAASGPEFATTGVGPQPTETGAGQEFAEAGVGPQGPEQGAGPEAPAEPLAPQSHEGGFSAPGSEAGGTSFGGDAEQIAGETHASDAGQSSDDAQAPDAGHSSRHAHGPEPEGEQLAGPTSVSDADHGSAAGFLPDAVPVPDAMPGAVTDMSHAQVPGAEAGTEAWDERGTAAVPEDLQDAGGADQAAPPVDTGHLPDGTPSPALATDPEQGIESPRAHEPALVADGAPAAEAEASGITPVTDPGAPMPGAPEGEAPVTVAPETGIPGDGSAMDAGRLPGTGPAPDVVQASGVGSVPDAVQTSGVGSVPDAVQTSGVGSVPDAVHAPDAPTDPDAAHAAAAGPAAGPMPAAAPTPDLAQAPHAPHTAHAPQVLQAPEAVDAGDTPASPEAVPFPAAPDVSPDPRFGAGVTPAPLPNAEDTAAPMPPATPPHPAEAEHTEPQQILPDHGRPPLTPDAQPAPGPGAAAPDLHPVTAAEAHQPADVPADTPADLAATAFAPAPDPHHAAAPAPPTSVAQAVHIPVTQPPGESHPDQPVGRFAQVAGAVPAAPHALALPPEDQQAQGPTAARAGDPELVQSAEDLDTRAADQEDRQDQEESAAAVEDVRQSTGPAAPAYDDAEREAVLKVMRERRDIRNGFRGDPIPHEVLLRVLEAAHTAPSVGHSQPWDFVVIRSADTRRSMHELATRQRDAYAKSLPKGRAKQFKELKIEAILDTPVNIVVTADPTRGGRHTLGRHTQPQMAPYSAALAVENLWLAARAEGLGVGWVSFFDEREMVRALGLPEHLEVIAYLCVGYVDEFPDEPELMQAGWSKRRPLSWVVHEETYGRRALPGEEPHDLLGETVAQIRPLDAKALGEAWERQKRMTKPAGALGMLEIISAQLSGLSRQCPPPIPEPAAVAIFAGDHGVHAQGVTPWPQEVTAQMVANFLGGGAVCNAFASQVGAEVCVVDVGVASDLPATPGLLPRKIRAGTSDMTTGPAMTREEAKQAIEVGIETARDLVSAGNKALLTGEMGIANTTASAALIAVFTGTDPAEVTGRGTGINDETLARKTEVVRRALDLHQPDPADPIGVLAAVGGFEHAAMVGLLLGGASLRTPVILDGVSAGAAALVARAIAPEVLAACIAGHRSAEPGHVAALNKLGLRPLVDLDLRLGEGTGALLALPLVQSTARAMHEVATFDSAGVTEK